MLFANGACGNINPPRQSDDDSAPEEFGQTLGSAIVELVGEAKPIGDPALHSEIGTVELPFQVQGAEEIEKEYQRAAPPGSDPWTARVMREWRDDVLAQIEAGTAPMHVDTDVQVFRIGPASFVALGGEVFSRMADDLRAAHGPHTYVVGYANGNLGYVPTREACAEGGYEVDLAYKLYANFRFAPEAFDVLRQKGTELLARLR